MATALHLSAAAAYVSPQEKSSGVCLNTFQTSLKKIAKRLLCRPETWHRDSDTKWQTNGQILNKIIKVSEIV